MAEDDRPRHARTRRGARTTRRAVVLALAALLLVGSSAVALTAAFPVIARRHHHRLARHGTRRAAASAAAGRGRPRHRPASARRPSRSTRARRPTRRRHHRPQPAPVTLAISGERRSRRVPAGYFGLSFEYPSLALDEQHPATFGRIVAMLHAPGTGPMTIRIGGDSAQQTFLAPRRGRMARWAFTVGRRWIARTRALVRRRHLRVILDLNQVSAEPAQAVALARRVVAGLPRGSVTGLELGNEPDLFQRSLWNGMVRSTPSLALRLPEQITPDDYDARYLADAQALAPTGLERHRFLAGPVLGEPRLGLRYIRSLLASPHPDLGAITVHQYPYSACDTPRQAQYPTIARLLSAHAMGAMYGNVAGAVRLADAAHLPLRVTEFNSVTCGGRRGVSNRFVTALWAPGALFEMLDAGVRSADLHARALAYNSPWEWNADGLAPRPLLYGLAFFVRALGPHARLLTTRVEAARTDHVSAWTVRSGSGAERVAIINRGPRPLRVRLPGDGPGPATVQRLTAPGPASTSARLDGQRLNRDGRWSGRRTVQRVAPRRGRLTVAVGARSAALVSSGGGGHRRREHRREAGRPRETEHRHRERRRAEHPRAEQSPGAGDRRTGRRHARDGQARADRPTRPPPHHRRHGR